MEKIKVNFGDKVIQFEFENFEKEIDTDSLMKIDYSNLVAELITFPVVVNKLGLLAADLDAEFRLAKLNLKITESKLRRIVREEMIEVDEKGKVSKPTVQEIEDAIQIRKLWRQRNEELNEAEKNKDYIYALYEAAKDKSRKLDKLSLTLQSGDVNEALVQKQMNRIYYKVKDGLIK